MGEVIDVVTGRRGEERQRQRDACGMTEPMVGVWRGYVSGK
jgi:hypothetical protein